MHLSIFNPPPEHDEVGLDMARYRANNIGQLGGEGDF